MSLYRHSVRRRFDSAAASYEARASVQAAVAERLVALLPPPGSVRRILEIGCGTGLLTRRLAARYPDAAIEALDHSSRMIETARRGLPGVAWRVADLLDYEWAEPCDLITSNCSLHWIQPIEAGLRKLRAGLAPGGRLVFSIMLDGTLGELRDARLRAAPSKPPLGRLPALEEVCRAAAVAGFRIEQSQEEILREEYPSATLFLRHIHDMGLTGGAISRAAVPLNRREIERLTTDYDRFRTESGGVTASYVAGYVVAG